MSNPRILLVDNDVKFLNSLKQYLEKLGAQVEIVMDGNNALEKAKDFDVVITGIVIPKMDGLKLSERIYNLTMGKTSVIIVSGIYKGIAIRNKALHNGKAVEFLEKPFSKEVIKKALKEKAHIVFEEKKEKKEKPKEEIKDEFATRRFDQRELEKESVKTEDDIDDEEKVSSEILFGDILEELNEEPEEVPSKVGEIKNEVEEEIKLIDNDIEEIVELKEDNEIKKEDEQKLEEKDEKIEIKEEKKKIKKEPIISDDSDIDKLISSITQHEKKKKTGRRTNVDMDDVDELVSKTLVDLRLKKKKLKEVKDLTPEQKKKQLEEIEKKIEKKQKSLEEEQKIKEKTDIVVEKVPAAKPEIKAEGKYQLIEKIATGGMAEIYKAKQRGAVGFEKIVTIKKILPHLANDEEFIEMFIDEAKIAASLSHPNIVQIFDLGKMDDEFIIAMEYIAGIDLGTINKKLRKNKKHFPIEIPLYITLKVSEALDYAHKKKNQLGQPMGIVHRDVNPNNILISFDGEIKLVDFGISKARVKLHHTIAGGLKGKYIYMSPEQASGKEVDLRTDIFALGILLYETLTLRNPFVSFSEPAILEKVKKAEYEDPRKLNPSLSEEIVNVINKCMKKNPDERYQSARELRNDLEKVLVKEVNNLAILKDILSKFVARNFPEETKKAGFTIDDTVEIVRRKDEIDKIISEKNKEEEKIKKDQEEIPEEEEEIIFAPIEEKPKEEKVKEPEIEKPPMKEVSEKKIKTYEDILREQKQAKEKEKEKIVMEKEIARSLKKEKHSGLPIFIILLVIIILAGGGYFAYQKFFNTSLPVVNKNVNYKTPPPPSEQTNKTNDLNITENQNLAQNPNDTTQTNINNQQTNNIGQPQQNSTVSNNTNKQQQLNPQQNTGNNTAANNIKRKTNQQTLNRKPVQRIKQKRTVPSIKPKNINKQRQQQKTRITNINNNNKPAQNQKPKTQNNQTQTNQTQTNQPQQTQTAKTGQTQTNQPASKPKVKPQVKKPKPIVKKQITREGDLVAYPQLDKPVKILKQVSPSLNYSEAKLGAVRIIMQVLVNTNGRADTFRIIRVIPNIAGFDVRVKRVIGKWRFSIPMKNGVKVKSWKTVSLLIKK